MEISKRSLQKMENIKTAAKDLFNQYGFNKVTMDSIVQHSNVSKGTLYKYFGDKQVLYEEIVMDIYNAERTAFHKVVETDGEFLSKIKQIIQIRVKKYTETHQKFFEDHFIRSENLNSYMSEYIQEVNDLRQKLYNDGRQQGYISKDINDNTLELYFNIIQMGLAQKYHDLSEMPKEDLMNVLNLIYSGMVSCK